MVGDSSADEALVIRALERGGYQVAHERVDGTGPLADALERQTWDVVVADYTLAAFPPAAILDFLRQRDYELPCIFISDVAGEPAAVGAMRAGGRDYILKSHLDALAPAVERELADTGARRERRRVEQRLAHLAYHDALTDLPNRLLLQDRLSQAVRVADRVGAPLRLLLPDPQGVEEVQQSPRPHPAGRALHSGAAALA